MSFGYSISDFIAIGEFALRVYREYRDAPAQFAAISSEVGSLHLVLKDVDSTVRERDLSPEKEADLIQICNGCRSVLTDLDALLQKYRNVGRKARWTWDRFKWQQSHITEMRSRVISNTGMLNAFNLSLASSVTSQIEKQLIQLRLEIQSGKREGSVITASSMKAAQGGDESIWREIRRELEDAGITEEMIYEHREFIATWVINAMNSGQLEEKAVRNVPRGESEILCSNAENPEAESTEDEAKEDSYPASDIESERALPDEVDSEDGSDEFLKAAAQKIAEFQRLGREAMEASDYNEAQHHLQKAKDLAVLLFGVQSRKAQDCCTLLEEVYVHRPLPRHQTSQQEMVTTFRMSDQRTGMSGAMNMASQPMGFSSPIQAQGSLTINTNPPFSAISTTDMMGNMMGYAPMGMEGISEDDANAMNMFSPTQFLQQYVPASMEPIGNDFMMQPNLAQNLPLRHNSMPVETSNDGLPNMPNGRGIYSSSGFDMLGALMKVATRKNPEINIGKVDMSCAFVVCDITQYDCPIIYVSDIFERLTRYSKHEAKGRNCRFLQSPEGKVEAGARREFVDNDSVYYLKNRIGNKKEAQRSLINYRKGGQPFMNLLTMIPITGEDDETIKYFVGFLIDLVEKPGAVEDKNAGGLYTVDYSQGMLPRYVWQPPEGGRTPLDGGQSISRDDVSTILSSINTSTGSDLTKRMLDKVLLENMDDVVHILSLKGLFLYLSPSSLKVLEYDPSELVGTALSSVCHPSDIVPVTRELKDTSNGASVNVVFRIRRKKSGYTWFESHGSLCVEQGKGRKCIILVGRERPVYALHRHDIQAAGGIGESEMWTKLSTSGMFLFVSSNVRALLDRSPDDLIGTSFQALMRAESRVEFGQSLEKARTGKRATHKHDILNRKGLVLQAQTTLYPGDASEGQKPIFLVAQTRLLKSSSRAVAPALTSHNSGSSMSPMARIDHLSEESTPMSRPSNIFNMSSMNQEISTPKSSPSVVGLITQAGGSGLAIGSQDVALASEDNIFDELKTTRCKSWQFELRQIEKSNRLLAEELAALLSSKKKGFPPRIP